MGFFNQIKVNLLSFTQLEFKPEKWYKVDLLLDWDSQNVAIFLDGKFRHSLKFYSWERDQEKQCLESSINALLLYTLSPGVKSTVKELRLCDDLCPIDDSGAVTYLDAEGTILTDPFAVFADIKNLSALHLSAASTTALLAALLWIF